MADENPVLSQASKKSGGRRRVVLRVIAVPFLLAGLLLVVLATTGLPLTPVARMGLRRAQLAPLEASIESFHVRWRLPGTLRLTLRGVRVEVRGADPVAAIAEATADFSIRRLLGGRLLPSMLTVSGAELWMRTRPDGGLESTIPPAAAGANEGGPNGKASPSQPFTLSAMPASCRLLEGEGTRVAITGVQLHVLPAVRQTTPWHSQVLALEGSAAGRNTGLTAQVALRNARGATLVEGTADLQPESETIVASLAIPHLGVGEALALLPPGLVAPGVSAESEADIRLHVQAQLPLTKEVTAEWEVHLASGRLTMPGQPKPLEFPETRLVGKGSLKGAELESTLRLAGGGSAPWIDIQAEAAVNLQSLKGSFRIKSPGADLARLAAMVPQAGVSFPAATVLRFETSGEVDWPRRAAENFQMRLDLDAGHVIVGPRELELPKIGVTVSGRAAPGFPESEASIAISGSAAFPQTTVAVDSDAVWEGKSGRLRVRSHSTPFDAGLFLQYVPRLPAGTMLALPVSWTVEADVDTRAGSMRQAKAALELGTGSLTMPEFFSAPVAIAPCRFAAEVEDQGATGKIAPYNWTVGPVTFHSDGGGWKRTGDRLEGGFSLGFERIKIADGIALLSQKLRAQLPAELAEVGDLAFASFEWREHLTGAWKNGQPVFDGTVTDGRLDLAFGPEPLSVLVHLEMPVPPLTAHIEVTVPDFVQARWRLPLLDRLPVPWLEAPTKAQFAADWEFPARLKSARWRVEAGAGRILPRGFLAKWLGAPFPLTRFAIGGSVGPDFSHFEIGEFLLESGRARCRFDEFSADLTSKAERRHLRVGGRLLLENWFAEDFIPLLKLPVREGLPGQGAALLDLGLQSFTASFDAAVAVEPSGNVVIESMKHDGSCVLRVGDQTLPLTTAAGYDPATRQVSVRTEIVDLRPAQFQPRLTRGLAVAPAFFDFPVSLSVEARSTVPADFPQTQPSLPEVGVTIHGGPGTIHRCDFLAADTPLRSLDLAASVSMGEQRLKSFRAKADFGGPVIGIESLRASFGDALAAEVAANLADLPLDWLLARVPLGLLDVKARAFLPGIAVSGVVRSLRVGAEARLPAGKDAKPEIVALRIDGELEKPAVRLKDWPALTIGDIRVAGDLQTVKVEVTDVQTGPVQVPTLEATASQILGNKPVVAGKLTVAVHLAELPGFLRSLPAPVILPEAFDWSKLAGNLTAEATYGADLARLSDPAAASVEMKLRVDGFTAPALAGRLETAPGSGEVSLKFKNGLADLEGTILANLQRGFDVVEGPVRARFTAHGELAGKAEATVGLDFKDASLRAPGGLAWQKAPGVESSLQAKVALADFHCPGNAASASFELAGTGLIYGRLGLKGRADAKLSPEGTPMAVKLVCDSIEADDTSLRLEADAALPRSLDVRLSGSRFDLRPLIRLAAPQLATLNAAANPGPGNAGAVAAKPAGPDVPAKPVTAGVGAVASSPGPGGVSPPAAATAAAPGPPILPAPTGIPPSGLPAETKVQVTLQEIVLGGGRTIAPFSLSAQLRGANPVSGELSFDSLNHGVRANLQPAADRGNWSLKIDDVADLLAVATAPLHELPASMTAVNTTIGGLIILPERFGGGLLTAAGTLDLDNVSNLTDGHLLIVDLKLRSEIPFLSSIAALVKRSVKYTIPIKEFRIDSFTLGRNDVHLQNASLTGPITLTAEKFDFNLATTELFLRGKVFGVWFDVTGPMSNLSFYLDDKNKGLNLLTTQDEFEW